MLQPQSTTHVVHIVQKPEWFLILQVLPATALPSLPWAMEMHSKMGVGGLGITLYEQHLRFTVEA
jgi:hypothetical protein